MNFSWSHNRRSKLAERLMVVYQNAVYLLRNLSVMSAKKLLMLHPRLLNATISGFATAGNRSCYRKSARNLLKKAILTSVGDQLRFGAGMQMATVGIIREPRNPANNFLPVSKFVMTLRVRYNRDHLEMFESAVRDSFSCREDKGGILRFNASASLVIIKRQQRFRFVTNGDG